RDELKRGEELVRNIGSGRSEDERRRRSRSSTRPRKPPKLPNGERQKFYRTFSKAQALDGRGVLREDRDTLDKLFSETLNKVPIPKGVKKWEDAAGHGLNTFGAAWQDAGPQDASGKELRLL